MGVKLFEQWVTSNQVVKRLDLKFLNGCRIGIEAAEFLRLLPQDVLLSALGGAPLALESTIKRATTELLNAGLGLHFVFDGLDSGADTNSLPKSVRAAHLSGEAFKLYENAQLSDAYESFRKSTSPDITTITDTLRKTLRENGIPFTVAPYSALAQLVYYERHPNQFIDAVFASSEIFCLGIDKIITKLDPENSSFWWIDRRDCLAGLGGIPTHIFVDALMLAGSSLLEQFPPLLDLTVHRKPYTFREVVDLLGTNNGSVARLCAQYPANPAIKNVYLDEYKRAFTRVKHHVIMTADGDVEILDKTHAPDDAHDCIGLRLPEELFMYLSRGMLRPRVLNWLTSGKIVITQPLAGGDGQAYQDLLKIQLDPLRRQALKLLTEPIHRYFQSRDITTKLWCDPSYDGKFNMKEVPSSREALSKWNVRNDLIAGWSEYFTAGTLQFAVLTLENADFAARTITPKAKSGYEPLKHRDEILANTVWRFLQLRGYVNEKHELTDWGEVLKTALDASGSRKDQEEAVFLAVELLRLGLVTPDTMFNGYAGAPERGSNIDKRNCMLVSRLACLGKIHHEPKRWSGPLSRHLLAYQSIISNVHASLRDLIEMILAAMFLEGLVDRDRDDWIDISLGLPFYEEHSCALGVVTMHYLDEVCAHPVPISPENRAEARTKVQDKAQHSDVDSSLDDAFKIWDALYKGVGVAGDKVTDRKMWDEVNSWLSTRR